MKTMNRILSAAVVATSFALPALAGGLPTVNGAKTGFQLSPRLIFPPFDAALGRKVFAAKGCVVCHSVNGIGGTDGPNLSYGKYDTPVNAMEVASDLWEKADIMIPMQKAELGAQIILSPEELAGLIGFLASPEEQAKLSKADIPANIRKDMQNN